MARRSGMDVVERLVPDGLWEIFQDVAPKAPVRVRDGPLMRGIPPIRSRYGPRRRRPAKLDADKGPGPG